MDNKVQPDILYKYLPANDDTSLERVKDLICSNKVYFAKPSDFNDPFDSRPNAIFDGNVDDWYRYFRTIIDRDYTHLSSKERDNKIKGCMENRHRINIEMLDKAADEVGIYCMTEVKDCLLMWGHYANNHKGLVCSFNMRDYVAIPIAYTDERIGVNFLLPEKKRTPIITKAVFSKFKKWEYEKEWRIVDHEDGPGIKIYPKGTLSEIIFGWKMEEETKVKITGWVEDSEENPVLYNAVGERGRFAIKIVPYKPNGN